MVAVANANVCECCCCGESGAHTLTAHAPHERSGRAAAGQRGPVARCTGGCASHHTLSLSLSLGAVNCAARVVVVVCVCGSQHFSVCVPIIFFVTRSVSVCVRVKRENSSEGRKVRACVQRVVSSGQASVQRRKKQKKEGRFQVRDG